MMSISSDSKTNLKKSQYITILGFFIQLNTI